MGSSKAKQAKKLLKAKAKLKKRQAKIATAGVPGAKTEPKPEPRARTSFLYNPWLIKIAGSIAAGIILYFLLGKN